MVLLRLFSPLYHTQHFNQFYFHCVESTRKPNIKTLKNTALFFLTGFHPRAAQDPQPSVKIWLQLALDQTWVYL